MKAISKPRHGFKNHLLKNLPLGIVRRLRQHLRKVELALRDPIHEPGETMRWVYFPETALISMLTVLKDGTHTEVASVGCDGMVGLPVVLGGKKSNRRAFCQMQGVAWRMSAAEIRRQTRRGGPFLEALHRYALALFALMAQLATCNRRHSIEQRCCCWLLMTHDRVEGDEFVLTHEFLSEMLGARRSGVTVIAGDLQRRGFISYRRGRVTILNRAGLEAAACECYGEVRKEFKRLVG